ncbi:MAG: 30S ribosomal protein S13, partial [Myxococcales bacterium]
MARISGVDLPREKRLEVSLTYIYGIGPSTAKKIIQAAGIDPTTRTHAVTEDELRRVREIIEGNYKV